jgi:hypothetical protein
MAVAANSGWTTWHHCGQQNCKTKKTQLFFGELALMDCCMTTIYYPLMAAASAVYAARCTLR